jgi:hypothetical protein
MNKIAFVLMLLMLTVAVSFSNTRDYNIYKRDLYRMYPLDYYWGWGDDEFLCNYPETCYGIYYYIYYDYLYRRKKFIRLFNEIDLLEKRKEESDLAREEISKIKVLSARFYREYTTSTLPIATAGVTVKNMSNYSIITIFFRGKLITHKTNHVIIDETFKYDLSNALLTGETNTFNIPLNAYGNWAKVKVSDLTKFEVHIVGVETDRGVVFVDSFSKDEQEKLNKLKKIH